MGALQMKNPGSHSYRRADISTTVEEHIKLHEGTAPVPDFAPLNPIRQLVQAKAHVMGAAATHVINSSIARTNEEVAKLRSQQHLMGQRLEGICATLQAELVEGSPEFSQHNVLVALAELKQVRDILS